VKAVRVNRGLLGWGVFFIVTGAVPLAVRNGMLDPARLNGAFDLWPLVLVGIGLGLLLAGTKAAILGGLVVAVTCGIMAGSLLAGATAFGFGTAAGACGLGSASGAGDAFETRQGSFTGPADVRIRMRCGSITGSSGAGPGWMVAGTASPGLAPDIAQSEALLTVTAPSGGGPTLGAAAAHWDVTLPDAVALDLEVGVDAGSAGLGLDRSQVTRLDVSVNAGDARIGLREDTALVSLDASANAGAVTLDLPSAPFRGRISVNLGSAEVCLPPGTALRVRADDVSLGSTNLAARDLVQQGSTWTTPGFAAAPVKVELDVSVNLGSFTLDPEDGCG
jgi:hypothetical protein